MPTVPLTLLGEYDAAHGIAMHSANGEGHLVITASNAPLVAPSPSVLNATNASIDGFLEVFNTRVGDILPILLRDEVTDGLRNIVAAIGACWGCPAEVLNALRLAVREDIDQQGESVI